MSASHNTERFWSLVSIQGEDDCWPWHGNTYALGYGRYSNRHAHRIAYELLRGPIPDDLVIDHLCRNTGCVNPAHMEPVTNAENVRRQFAAQTECRNGHPYTPENTRRHSQTGRRVCRACTAAQWQRFYAKRKASGG